MTDISEHLAGLSLYGDDFGQGEIEAWFRDEEEGYADLGAKDSSAYRYGYHALNVRHGFRFVTGARFHNVLGFGSAYGHELAPVADKIDRVTIVDPSDAFHQPEVFGIPATYVKPSPSGTLPFPTGSFDLVTCFGVLHHIPNVSFVMNELARVIARDGHLIVREPIVSMGDWRRPRTGLTKRERGIPLRLLRSFAESSGLSVLRESLCMFPTTARMFKLLTPVPYNSALAVRLDALVCAAFAWNVNYHPANALQRLRPTSAFLVLRKTGPSAT